MNKQELVKRLAEAAELKKTEAERAIDGLVEIISQAMSNCEEVTVPGLGKFSAKLRAARTGHNPATGEAIDIPEKRVPHFSAAKALKEAAE